MERTSSEERASGGLPWLIATALWRAGICDQDHAQAFGAALAREIGKQRRRRRSNRRLFRVGR